MQMAAIFLPPILARTLTIEDYGVYKQIDLAAALFAPFLILGFDKSITYFVPRKDSNPTAEISSAFGALLSIAIAAIGFALFFPDLFGRAFGTETRLLVVVTAALYAVASALALVGARTLISVDRAKTAALLPAYIGIPRTVALVVVALFFPSLEMLFGFILGSAVVTCLAWIGVLIRYGHLRVNAMRLDVLRKHASYGGVLALASLIQTWAQRVDRYLVSTYLPVATFAIYSNGKTRVPFLPILSRSLGDAVAPRYSKLESDGKYAEMATLWNRSVEALLPFGILTSLFLSLTAEWTIPLIYGEKFLDSVTVFQVFSWNLLLQSLVSVEQILRALSALRYLLATMILSLALRTVACLVILRIRPEHTLELLVTVQLVATLITFLVRIVYIRKRLGVGWGHLTPTAALRLALPLGALGAVGSWGIERSLGHHHLLLPLGASVVWWGMIIGFALWRQGVVHQILPDAILRRLPARLRGR
jgi:O-antigen/teichoic acid export membrane protein